MRSQFASSGGVLDIDAVANGLGCRLTPPRPSGSRSVEATLTPRRTVDSFSIQVDPCPRYGWGDVSGEVRAELGRHRYRFRVAHELGHTFFFSRRPGGGPKRLVRWSKSEEVWCDEFARSLLVPPRVIKQMPQNAETIFNLQKRFDVSLELAARALAQARPRLGVALWFWLTAEKPAATSLVDQWSTSEVAREAHQWRRLSGLEESLVSGAAVVEAAHPTRRGQLLRCAFRCDEGRRQIAMTALRI